jgi:hypothetical protein
MLALDDVRGKGRRAEATLRPRHTLQRKQHGHVGSIPPPHSPDDGVEPDGGGQLELVSAEVDPGVHLTPRSDRAKA